MQINQIHRLNKKGRDFFVGDIHGGYRSFTKVFKHLSFSPSNDRVFCVGDLIDRGDDSFKCLELLNEKWFYSVLGNHENFLLEIEEDKSYKAEVWYRNGGSWWKSLCPEKRSLSKSFVEKLPLTISVETNKGIVGLVHADYPFLSWPPIEKCTNSFQRMLWGREDHKAYKPVYISNVRFLISGHTPVKDAFIKGNRIYIDTGEGYFPNEVIPSPRLTVCEISDDFLNFYSFEQGKLVCKTVDIL